METLQAVLSNAHEKDEDKALKSIAESFGTREFKKALDTSFDKSKKEIRRIKNLTETDKKRFDETFNSAIRKNDIMMKQLQNAFTKKELDIIFLWHLALQAHSILSVIEFKDKEKRKEVLRIFERYDMASIMQIFNDITYQQELNVFVGMGRMKSKLYSLTIGNDGQGHLLLLSFVSALFDDTEIARETVSSGEEFDSSEFDEEPE